MITLHDLITFRDLHDMITLQVEASGGCVSVAVGPPIRLVSAPRGQAVLGIRLPMRPQVRATPS